MDEEVRLKKALLKKALGYDANEEVFEYVFDEDGQQKLSKKKVTKKHYAPDITAVKMIFDRFYSDDANEIYAMSDEELQEEKKRLLKILMEEEENGNDKVRPQS